MRSKLKNYITGNTLEKTFRAGESLAAATIENRDCQFSYIDGDDVSFKSAQPLSAMHSGYRLPASGCSFSKHATARQERPVLMHYMHSIRW